MAIEVPGNYDDILGVRVANIPSKRTGSIGSIGTLDLHDSGTLNDRDLTLLVAGFDVSCRCFH